MIPLQNEITLNTLLKNTQNRMKSSYFEYRAFSWNCQDFIENILRSNGLATPENIAFVKQDVKTLLKGLPAYSSFLANTSTRSVSIFNRFLQSITRGKLGLRDGGLVH
jgi:hypothetical protein